MQQWIRIKNLGDRKKLFVYGTLKKGKSNDHILKNATWIGVDKVFGFEMRNLGSFPGATKMPHAWIHGEVYEIDERDLIRVDRLESYPSFYDRELVKTDKGYEAWIYFISATTKNTVIESGRW